LPAAKENSICFDKAPPFIIHTDPHLLASLVEKNLDSTVSYISTFINDCSILFVVGSNTSFVMV
jgi:hypothetical protein